MGQAKRSERYEAYEISIASITISGSSDTRIDACSVGSPDFDIIASDRLASGDVDHCERSNLSALRMWGIAQADF